MIIIISSEKPRDNNEGPLGRRVDSAFCDTGIMGTRRKGATLVQDGQTDSNPVLLS